MFLEKIQENGSQNIATNHLTEAEEAVRKNKHDMHHQRACEKYADTALKKCSEVRF